jgi:hypothetical protein
MAEQKANADAKAKAGAEDEGTLENKVLPQDAPKPPGDVRVRRVAKERRKGPFVKYVGPASHREIDATAWKSLQIELKDDTVTSTWNVANDKMLEADNFS